MIKINNIFMLILILILLLAFHLNCDVYVSIGTCNVTCTQCYSSTSPNYCLGCEAGMVLSSSNYCVQSVNDNNYYNEYFTSLKLSSSDIDSTWSYGNPANYTELTSSQISNCANGSSSGFLFTFTVIGLFQNQISLTKTITYVLQVQRAYIMFRALYLLDPITFTVTINDVNVLTKTLANLNTTTAQTCSSFTNNSYNLYYNKFITSAYSGITFSLAFSITANFSTSVTSSIWGLRELVIVSKQCDSCVSSAVLQQGYTIGIVMAILASMVIVLITPIIISTAWTERQRKAKSVHKKLISQKTLKKIYIDIFDN